MTDPPTLDGRTERRLRADLSQRADGYLPAWDPETDGNGTALLDVGASFGAGLLDRLDEVPAAHRRAFAAMLGTDRRPPKVARLPLSVDVSPNRTDNVDIPGGTRAETGDGVRFATADDGGFEATPASPVTVYGVDPGADRIVDHTSVLDGETGTLFEGADCGGRRLYVGDESLDVAAGTEVAIDAVTTPESATLTWEYYGEGNSNGDLGWQPLHTESRRVSSVEALRERRAVAEGDAETVVLPTSTAETVVGGAEGYWLRCRSADSDVTVESVTVAVGTADPSAPAALVANDVPLPVEGPVRPFGQTPQPPSTLYVRTPAATAADATVTVTFEPAAGDDVAAGQETSERVTVATGPPSLSWEYADGDGWAPLPTVEDTTDQLRTPGRVEFRVPEDAVETAVSGRCGPWLRVRLVAGSYADGVPQFGGITVAFEGPETGPDHLLTGGYGAYTPVDTLPARPFERRTDTERTLYLGFDGPLSGGPLALFWAVIGERAAPGSLRIECLTADGWDPVGVDDGTVGLSSSGVLRCRLPAETVETTVFGRSCHWLRLRSPDGWSDEWTPTVEGLWPNTVWASHARSVERDPFGSSDGSGDQRFDCRETPVLDPAVWVEESETLSSDELAVFREERPEAVEIHRDESGSVTDAWVRWERRDDFRSSGPSDRHYLLDRTAGTVRFGDGTRGAVPPSGTDNVRVAYRTGGGADGNVPAGAVKRLYTDVSAVRSVDNPLPADGGSDAETTEAATERAGPVLRTRGRAVTVGDVRDLARTVDGRIERTHCRAVDGGLEVVVLPEASTPRPDPTATLRSKVETELDRRTPATVTAVTVTGPTYVPVDITAIVDPAAEASAGSVREAVRRALTAWLHPVTGGPDGEGWTFGRLPSTGSLQSAVTDLDRVAAVESLAAGVDGVACAAASLSASAVVCDGEHDITVTAGGEERGSRDTRPR